MIVAKGFDEGACSCGVAAPFAGEAVRNHQQRLAGVKVGEPDSAIEVWRRHKRDSKTAGKRPAAMLPTSVYQGITPALVNHDD